MTPEEIADFEEHASEIEGRPFKMPEAGHELPLAP